MCCALVRYLRCRIINCPDILNGFLSSSLTCHILSTDGLLITAKTFFSTGKELYLVFLRYSFKTDFYPNM